METKDLADALMIWLPKLAAGKTLRYCATVNNAKICVKISDVVMLVSCIEDGCKIEVQPIPFPDAPDGEEWHNPDRLTAERVGVDDGWRLLLVSEITDALVLCIARWCEPTVTGNPHCWVHGNTIPHMTYSYRVRTCDHPVGSLKPAVETNPLDEKQHKAIFEDLVDGFMRLSYRRDLSETLATAVMDGRISKHITVK